MVSFKGYCFQASILLVLLFITPSFARLSVKVTKGVVNDICSKTQNPSFCLAFLSSTRGIGSADLQGLAKITIDLARSNATRSRNLISSLISKTTNPELKEGYTSCSEHFGNAISDLDDARENLRKGDPNGVNIAASAAMTEAGDCEDELEGLPADPSIPKGSKDLNSIGSIILVISNLLPRLNEFVY